MSVLPEPVEMTRSQRIHVLVVAFLGWLFGGLQIALFVLIHRPAMIGLLAPGESLNEQSVAQWFAWYQAAFLIGAASGGWIFGVLGDRIGRTRSLGLSVLCYSLFTGACYFARTPSELLVLRFLACHGIGGAWPNTVALVAEAWPSASRPLLAGVLGTAANVGQVLMGAGVRGHCGSLAMDLSCGSGARLDRDLVPCRSSRVSPVADGTASPHNANGWSTP